MCSLLQAGVYQHFQGMGNKDAWAGYREDRYPRAMLFVPLSGTPDNYRNHLDRMDLSFVAMTPYGEHREAHPFERVNLFIGWPRYGDRTVKYMSERVHRQFGRVQTIPRHPVEVAPPETNLGRSHSAFSMLLIMR